MNGITQVMKGISKIWIKSYAELKVLGLEKYVLMISSIGKLSGKSTLSWPRERPKTPFHRTGGLDKT